MRCSWKWASRCMKGTRVYYFTLFLPSIQILHNITHNSQINNIFPFLPPYLLFPVLVWVGGYV